MALTKKEKKRLSKLKKIYREKNGNLTLQQKHESQFLLEKSKPLVDRKSQGFALMYLLLGGFLIIGGLIFYFYNRNFFTGSCFFLASLLGLYIISNSLNKFTW